MLNFCTLFNTQYLAKGIALYQSLLKVCPDFHLYIFAFDDISLKVLNERDMNKVTIISLSAFENQSLLEVKKTRSTGEYCWTCTPFTVIYCIENYQLDHCTYLDADTYFYSDPTILIEAMGTDSVLITPHNYNIKYDQRATAGIYCVQFLTFKNNNNGMKVLNWWANACLKWCFKIYEDGKLGDQKYLDSWPYMFEGVHICRSHGAGLAPWNAINYKYELANNRFSMKNQEIIFYHFHELKYLSNGKWCASGYQIPKVVLNNIYFPYIEILKNIDKEIAIQYPNVDALGTTDIKTKPDVTLRYKVNIYITDMRRAIIILLDAIFFIKRSAYYRNTYLKVK